jgi:adenylate cyclase
MVEERVERRLTAILAADVAGYSRLMGADEEATLGQLKAHRRALVDPKVEEHHGRIIKTTGDGMLIEFASVVNAVRCAVEIQRGMIARNADVPQQKRIEFRIGINVGDIIIDGGDIFGDGVNVAARLEGLAKPGGICVSARVQEDIRGKLDETAVGSPPGISIDIGIGLGGGRREDRGNDRRPRANDRGRDSGGGFGTGGGGVFGR